MRWDDDTIRDFASQFDPDEVFSSDMGRSMILRAGVDLITGCSRDSDAASRFGRCAATAEHLFEGARRSEQVRTDVPLVVVHGE